jgi:hypothetical protein
VLTKPGCVNRATPGLAKASGRKRFFFEKKNQKTFANLVSAFPERLARICKSFLLLFFKKEVLPFLPPLLIYNACRRRPWTMQQERPSGTGWTWTMSTGWRTPAF